MRSRLPSRRLFLVLALPAIAITTSGASCSYKVDYFCDEETQCADRYPDRPFCDLHGEYPASEGIAKTCIPDPFGIDGGADASSETGDAGPDGSTTEPPATPLQRSPINGKRTGSPFTSAPALANPPLRPTFRWQAAADATSYQLQVDDSCEIATYRQCSFPSPEVDLSTAETTHQAEQDLEISLTAPVGRRYFWRVRACAQDACSDWSPVRYVDVGRHWSDFNGDGYADLLVGAPQQAGTDAGTAYVFNGAGGGISETPDRVLSHPDSQANAGFGNVVAAIGDINADGFADAAVAAPMQDVSTTDDRGRVYLYHGSSTGLPSAPSGEITGPLDVSLQFAVAASAGDVNGDGYDDLVVTDLARAYLFYGGSSGLPASPTQPLIQSAESFGHSVAVGDLNGDGFADVSIGAPAIPSGDTVLGQVFVYYGADPVLIDDPQALAPPTITEAGHTGKDFGVAAATIADRDGDGFEDLALSYDTTTYVQAGLIYLFSGTSPSLSGDALHVGSVWTSSLSCAGDLNGDGLGDLLIGWWSYTGTVPPMPRLAALYGGGDSALYMTGVATGGVFVSGGDVNGDGFDDAIVGLPLADDGQTGEGHVGVYYGSLTGLPEVASVTLDNPDDETNGHFGAAVSAGR